MYICFKIVAGVGGIGAGRGLLEGGCVTCAQYALPGAMGGHKSRQGSPVAYHRHTRASCRKALQTCPRQFTSAKPPSLHHKDRHVIPGTTRAQRQPACMGSPAVPTAAGRGLCTKTRAIALEMKPSPNCWSLKTHSSKANDHH